MSPPDSWKAKAALSMANVRQALSRFCEIPLSQFDLAIDDMRKPDGANLQCHCCPKFLASAQMACPYCFPNSDFDLALRGDADFLQEFADGSVELLFIHGSPAPVPNLFMLANGLPALSASSGP